MTVASDVDIMRRFQLASILLFLAAAPLACGGRTPIEESPCIGESPTCVAPGAACEGATTVNAECDATAHVWSCPRGSRTYARAADSPTTCSPFRDGLVAVLGGSLARVPVDGGRCLWVADAVLSSSGAEIHNAGFFADPSLPFGTCPTTPTFPSGTLSSVVTIEGSDDPSLLVQIDGGFVFGGETRVLYRLFRTDPSAVFGVDLLGGGVGVWDAGLEQIVVPGPSSLVWGTSNDMGDASLVVGGVPFIWGCHGPGHFLTLACDVGHMDAGGAIDLLTSGGAWVPLSEASMAETVFDAGPWISSVLPSPAGGFAHVYAASFGGSLETHTSTAVLGPWTSGPTLAACDLPTSDTHAFCAGPVVHTELMDPTRPSELVVSYQVGTTASVPTPPAGTLADAYGSRLVWVSLP
jgi:hypothetical protein